MFASTKCCKANQAREVSIAIFRCPVIVNNVRKHDVVRAVENTPHESIVSARQEIVLANALKESRQAEAIPVHTAPEAIAPSDEAVANNFQIAGIFQREFPLIDNTIAIQIRKTQIARRDARRAAHQFGVIGRFGNFFFRLEEAKRFVAPDVAKVLTFVKIAQEVIWVVETGNFRREIRCNNTQVVAQRFAE